MNFTIYVLIDSSSIVSLKGDGKVDLKFILATMNSGLFFLD